jgi:hypothetical protein
MLTRLRQSITELGLANGLWYAAAHALSRLTRGKARIIRYHLVAQPVAEAPAADERPGAALVIRPVPKDDPAVTSFPRPPKVIAWRYADGARCFGAFMREEFAGFLWLKENAYDEDEVRCRYELASPDTCVWDFDVYVEPRYRIGRTFSRLWDAANRHMLDTGKRWSLSRISAFNPASLASHKRLGLRDITTATFVVIGPWQLSLLGQSPFVHFSTRETSRPTVKLVPPG